MKWLILLGLGFGAYYLYEQSKSQPVAKGLPADANPVQTMTLAGIPVTVYLSSSGYYLKSGASSTILGPYSTAQVSAALNAKSAISKLAGAL